MKDLTLRTGMVFVAPEVETLTMSSSVTGDVSDGDMGLGVMAMAQVSVVGTEDAVVRYSMFMTREELGRAIVEMRAVYETMTDSAALADRHWQRYRDSVRARR